MPQKPGSKAATRLTVSNFLAAFFTASVFALSAAQTALAQDTEVDVELFLAVDVSRSMSPWELEIQRRGYAEALASPEVFAAIEGGFLGKIAITYVEWAGNTSHRTIVPWTLIDSPQAAEEIAQTLVTAQKAGMRRTSISGVLRYAADTFGRNEFQSFRHVIDVSGDGPNNQGEAVTEARDAVIAQGIVINGLPLMTQDAQDNIWGIDDLDRYYENCVTGGPGSFVIPVDDWDQFSRAVRRKLVLEIVGLPSDLRRASVVLAQDSYDCQIGEKLWEQNRGGFGRG